MSGSSARGWSTLPVVTLATPGRLREGLQVELLVGLLTLGELALGLPAGAGRGDRPVVFGAELILERRAAPRLDVAPREEREHHERRDDDDDDPPRRIHAFLLGRAAEEVPRATGRQTERGRDSPRPCRRAVRVRRRRPRAPPHAPPAARARG